LTFTHITPIFTLLSSSTPTSQIYRLSLHDALPISVELVADRVLPRTVRGKRDRPGEGLCCALVRSAVRRVHRACHQQRQLRRVSDRKSTRLNSSHEWISYAVFCLKKKRI